MEFYLAIKWNEAQICFAVWTNLENTTFREKARPRGVSFHPRKTSRKDKAIETESQLWLPGTGAKGTNC